MENENNKQNIDIATIKTQVDAILKKQDELMDFFKWEFSSTKESFKGRIQMVDDRITREFLDQREICAERKKMIDNHCGRLRKLETEGAVSKFKLSGLIFILTAIFTLIIQTVWGLIAKK